MKSNNLFLNTLKKIRELESSKNNIEPTKKENFPIKEIKPPLSEISNLQKPIIISGVKIENRTGFTREEWNRLYGQNPQLFYGSNAWALIRIKIITKYEGLCQTKLKNRSYCHKPCSTQVHHLNDPRFYPELALDEKNLILLCDECHNKTHDHSNQKNGNHNLN